MNQHTGRLVYIVSTATKFISFCFGGRYTPHAHAHFDKQLFMVCVSEAVNEADKQQNFQFLTTSQYPTT